MTFTFYDPLEGELPPALGIVLDQDRGSLPYSLIHGEALVACAAWALGEAGEEDDDEKAEQLDQCVGHAPTLRHETSRKRLRRRP